MNTITEYTTIDNNWIKVITKKEAEANKTSNVYYLDWVREDKDYSKWERAKDEDIILKDIFVLDLDLRNNFDWEVSNEDIIFEWENLVKYLEVEDEFFWEWSEIIFTWNWLHIIYRWTPATFTKEQYSIGVSRIYKQWDKFMWDKLRNCDKACKNLARILRLPWSINQKNWAVVKIIWSRKKESRLFNLIKTFAIKESEELEKQKKIRQAEIAEQLKDYWKEWNKVYEQINLIPAYQIVQLLVPEFPYDWKKNFKNKKWWYTWYFINHDTNTTCNWWSTHYFTWGTTESCYNNFTLVKKHKNWNSKETFIFFKELLWMN